MVKLLDKPMTDKSDKTPDTKKGTYMTDFDKSVGKSDKPNPVGRPPKYTDPEEMQVLIDQYFDHCRINRDVFDGNIEFDADMRDFLVTDNEFPTVSGLGVVLDLSRQSMINYDGKPEFLDTIKLAKMRIEGGLEQRLFHNNATGTIFNLKNNFSWNDKSEVDMATTIVIGSKDGDCG